MNKTRLRHNVGIVIRAQRDPRPTPTESWWQAYAQGERRDPEFMATGDARSIRASEDLRRMRGYTWSPNGVTAEW